MGRIDSSMMGNIKSTFRMSFLSGTASFALMFAANFSTPAFAAVRLPAIISDHMVVQANDKPRIWGWADPSEKIQVKYLDKILKTHADETGKWEVHLGKIAPGKTFDLTVKAANEIIVKDVVAGQVWVCSGQSNMEFALGKADNSQAELDSTKPPDVRFFKTRRMESASAKDDVEGVWTTFSKTNSSSWSAVGYYFAKKLNAELQEPVGMVESAVGGTQIKTWMSPELISTKLLNETPPVKASDKKSVSQDASCFYNGMVNGYTPYTISGFLWYQGEANAGQAGIYNKLLTALINDWRTKWNAPQLPFLFVQLPNYGTNQSPNGKNNWAELREAQSQTLKVSGTGMAVTIDLGDAKNIHPTNKEPVGSRLALAALNIAYHRKVPYKGPVMDTIKQVNNTLVIHFKNADEGLCLRPLDANDTDHTAKGFFISDGKQQFYPADAKIEGDTITLTSTDVLEPTAIRYGWSDDPVANLQNGLKLQASPFRASLANGNESIPGD